jgi:hypothetical protein
MTLKPQLRQILNHTAKVGYITQRAAINDYGIMALPRRMKDLSELGYAVRTESRKNPATGQRYVRYYIEGKAA